MRQVLHRKTIDVWYGDIFSSEFDPVADYRGLLNTEERARADKMGSDCLRRRYQMVRSRLRLLLSAYTKTRPEDIRFAQKEYGKPFLPEHPEIAFNISHSGNKLTVAVSEQVSLGIDIECWKDRVNLSALVKKCFADVERDFWHQLPETRKTAVFYDFWTRKEAFVKAVGRGIALGLDRCVVSPERPTLFIRVPPNYGPASAWKIIPLPLGQGISGAVSVRDHCRDIRMHAFQEIKKQW